MSGCCDKNPLQRSGISQEQRFLDGLQPGYIAIDERRFADWIFFADEFSRYLNYYDATGTKNGDWKIFFSMDISAILGSIAVQDVDVYRASVKERFDFIKDNDNAGDITGLKQKLNELFSSILSLSQSLDDYLRKLPDKDRGGENDFVFKTNLLNLIKTKLAPALKRLLSYYKAVDDDPASDPDFLESSDMTGWKVLNVQVVTAEGILGGSGLSSYWLGGAADWTTFLSGISPDESVFGPAAWSDDRRINNAANHNLFSSIFDQYLQVYTRIVQDAEKTLMATLENWDIHPPHYALFLSFLRLFRLAQSNINSLTKRHLDFYYKEVLRLQLKEAEPNSAHILTELAKPVDDYALKAATAFKAGKDSEDKDVTYTLDKETTFNKAKVVLLKSLYKGDADGNDDHQLINNKGRFFASPVANSDDGEGAKLRSTNNEWAPYANKKFTDGELTDIVMPNAQIGFAIASHFLFLAEGKRLVKVKLALSDNSLLSDSVLDGSLTLEGYLTTEKEWYEISSSAISVGTSTIADGSETVDCTEISFTLMGDEPAITAYDAAIHGGTYNVTVPVLKIYLKNEDGIEKYSYDDLKGLTVSKTEVRVEVGDQSAYSQTGLKQLLLANDFGSLDASKPFMPFGPIPTKGSSLVIGNSEALTKKNLKVLLNIEWKAMPSNGDDVDFDKAVQSGTTYSQPEKGKYPKVTLQYLSGGVWNNVVNSKLDIIVDDTSTSKPLSSNEFPSTIQAIADNGISDHTSEYSTYTSTSKEGFIKIKLNRSYGHSKYDSAIVTYLIEKANDNLVTYKTEPVKPYTPVIQSLYLAYTAHIIHSLSKNNKKKYDKREIQFFNIGPFGEAEQHAYLSGADGNPFLLPQFSHTGDAGTVHHTGEFYIGIENLSAEQSVNILFQSLEGSSDPLVAKPDDHIHWSYLSSNQWVAFDEQEVSDDTLQLVQSGIISFVIPEDATTGNTLLPSGYLWLRAAVGSAAETVCKLITVDAQAAVVTFSPNNNAADFMDTALAAGTISKLKEPDSSVKKIVQPYSSFGGRAKESSENFYVRISERLRHKGRAITIWDYEHLVLEAFPSIHKVKCLNHTFFDEISGNVEYNEVAPGYVTLITIPDLKNRNDANPLRPYTNQDVLTSIEEFLKEKVSCHVKLKAKNPRFEEVWISFKLKLIKGYDDFTFYSGQLKEEITQFLTPWAYSGDADIQFGGNIQKSVIIDFIEERYYVDYITDVKMYQNVNPDNEDTGGCDDINLSGDLDEAQASTARSILVSASSTNHQIEQIDDTETETEESCPGLITESPSNS